MAFDRYTDIAGMDFDGQLAYLGSEENGVHAFDIQTGALVWESPLIKYRSATAAHIRPVVKDNICYAVGESGVVVALNAKTGKLIWSRVIDPGFEDGDSYYAVGPLTVSDKWVVTGGDATILTGGEHNMIYVINRADGTLNKVLELGDDERLTGVVNIQNNVLLIPAKNLYAYDIAANKLLWTYKMDDLWGGAGTPLVKGNKVLFQGSVEGTSEGRLLCVDLSTGAKIWETDAGNGYAGVYDPLIVGDYVIGVYERGSSVSTIGNGRPFVANVNDGKIVWANDRLSVGCNPVYANGRLFFHGQDFDGAGNTDANTGLMCLDATSGKLIWLNPDFPSSSNEDPIVSAENGIFKAGYAQ